MSRFNYTGFLLAGLIMTNGAMAAQNKSCVRQARADYRTELKNCKTKSGDTRKACIKEAKEKEKMAKTACKKTS